MVYSTLKEAADEHGICSMTQEEIAERARCCEKSVRTTITELRRQRVILVTREEGMRNNCYRFIGGQ
jgi:transcription initiation factor IIE alpha subunit